MSLSKDDEIQHLEYFIDSSMKRYNFLNAKQFLTKAEGYEMDMCFADVQRANNRLKELRKTPPTKGEG